MKKIDDHNIVKFYEFIETGNNIYLIMEYCNGGTLEQKIKDCGGKMD